MANMCSNMLYVYSEDPRNLDFITSFFEENFSYYDSVEHDIDSIDIDFESKWVFPEELMNELFENIPNKEDIYMRCLSYEFGCLYHAMWICDGDGWKEV